MHNFLFFGCHAETVPVLVDGPRPIFGLEVLVLEMDSTGRPHFFGKAKLDELLAGVGVCLGEAGLDS